MQHPHAAAPAACGCSTRHWQAGCSLIVLTGFTQLNEIVT